MIKRPSKTAGKEALLVATLMVLDACGGGGSSHVEISGKSPAEGSALAANAVCRHEAACGSVSISCSGGSGMATQCSATITRSQYAACYADAQPDIQQLLSCPSLTAGQIDMIEQCVDALVALPCVTQAQADAQARATEMGMSPPGVPDPPECDWLREPVPGCP